MCFLELMANERFEKCSVSIPCPRIQVRIVFTAYCYLSQAYFKCQAYAKSKETIVPMKNVEKNFVIK